MSGQLCGVEDCTNDAHVRGWCVAHYQRWRTHGDVLAGKPIQQRRSAAPSQDEAYRRAAADSAFLEQLKAKCARTEDGCLLWVGARVTNGYGTKWYAGHSLKVHVVMLTASTGLRPAGLQAGHVCHDRAVAAGECEGGITCHHRQCCEPTHLAWQTPTANIAASPRVVTTANAGKQTCPAGHELVRDNLIPSQQTRGWRQCLQCLRERREAIRSAHTLLGMARREYGAKYGWSVETAKQVIAQGVLL